jgi:hypothetical protein
LQTSVALHALPLQQSWLAAPQGGPPVPASPGWLPAESFAASLCGGFAWSPDESTLASSLLALLKSPTMLTHPPPAPTNMSKPAKAATTNPVRNCEACTEESATVPA